ncbi:hypothetical protein [Halorubrum vacuolatum]|uniref:Uncharacterized protein n=1 Tax=Halorubrum vacuolatum TaxID=63740 RepID=A0A238YC55_HALVU|nr:hypothetical protein [Halorubrum vacuolatum]SNR68331.1 hypothetical protein SAMN06264855_13610 [Halorubrum vacuolatum]
MEEADRGITRSYDCASVIDIPTALSAGSIEHLGVDSQQEVIIYHRAILILTTTEGDLDAAEAIEIELWEPPLNDSTHDPVAVIETLVAELREVTDTALDRN